MKYRVDMDLIGRGNAGAAYGGFLHAWSFRDIEPHEGFEEFRQTALAAMGRRFLPVYHMADGSLVAAGIGSANILRQLQPLNTLSLDIGGLMNCFADRQASQHGGVIRLPDFENG